MATKSFSQHNNHKKHELEKEDIQEYFFKVAHLKAVEWIKQHLKIAGIAAGVIVLIFIIFTSWNSYQHGKEVKALNLEAKAFTLHEEIQAKNSTTEDASAEAADPYQKVITLYQKLLDEYSGTQSAERAVFFLGSLEYERGKYEQAQEYYSKYLKDYPQGTLMLDAKESLGYVFEQQNEYQQALDTFQELQDKVSSGKKTEVLLAIGRNYEALQKPEEALAIYQEIVDSNTSFSLKNKAKERVDFLQEGTQQTASDAEPAQAASE